MNRPALILAALSVILTGCAEVPSLMNSGSVELHVEEHDAPYDAFVLVRNTGDAEILVSSSGFRIVDAEGIVSPSDSRMTYEYGSDAFPLTLRLAPGEAARGWIAFAADSGTAPYTLSYTYAGATANASLDEPQASGEPGASIMNEAPEPVPMEPAQAYGPENPAPIGTWINGTHLDARLVSITTTKDSDGYDRTTYLWELAFRPPTNASMRLTFKPVWSAMGSDLEEPVEVWEFTLRGDVRGNIPLGVFVDHVRVADAAQYIWARP